MLQSECLCARTHLSAVESALPVTNIFLAHCSHTIRSGLGKTYTIDGLRTLSIQSIYKYIEDNDIIDDKDKSHKAGVFHLLGGEKEMPWAYERLFKYDIIDVAKLDSITTDHPVKINVTSVYYNSKPHQVVLKEAVLVERPPHANFDIVVIPVSSSNQLVHKIRVKKGTRVKFVTSDLSEPMEDLGSYTTMVKCKIPPFSFNTYDFGVVHMLVPGEYFFVPKNIDLCKQGRNIQTTVEDE